MSPTISSRLVKKTRRAWFCEACQKHRPAGTSCRSFFGAPERGDKPYTVRACEPPCEARLRAMEEDA